jgi:hypothetical protein
MRPFPGGIPGGEVAQFTERDGRGVDQAQHRFPVAPDLAVGERREHRKGIGEHPDRAPGVGIGQRGSRQLCCPQVVMVVGVGIPAGDHAAQTVQPAELSEDQRQQVVPAME